MDAARAILRDNPARLSQRALVDAIRESGVPVRNEDARAWLRELVEKDSTVRLDQRRYFLDST
jgi:hypothetical protein